MSKIHDDISLSVKINLEEEVIPYPLPDSCWAELCSLPNFNEGFQWDGCVLTFNLQSETFETLEEEILRIKSKIKIILDSHKMRS